MKFEVSETIITKANKTEVFNSLSTQLSKVSKSLNRYDSYLKVRLIEASFGSVNRNDVSIISVRDKSDGYLLIADVTYIPSIWFWIIFILTLFTWVGWVVPLFFYFYQKNTVRDAINNVFIRVKNEFQDSNNNNNILYNNSNNNSLDQLEKLHGLKEKGVISEEEYLLKKKEYLK